MEVFFDEPHLPQVVGGLQVFEVVAAIDVDEVKLALIGRVALLGEPCVEHQVVLLRLAGELAPDDERSTTVGFSTCHSTEPVRAGLLLFGSSAKSVGKAVLR